MKQARALPHTALAWPWRNMACNANTASVGPREVSVGREAHVLVPWCRKHRLAEPSTAFPCTELQRGCSSPLIVHAWSIICRCARRVCVHLCKAQAWRLQEGNLSSVLPVTVVCLTATAYLPTAHRTLYRYQHQYQTVVFQVLVAAQ